MCHVLSNKRQLLGSTITIKDPTTLEWLVQPNSFTNRQEPVTKAVIHDIRPVTSIPAHCAHPEEFTCEVSLGISTDVSFTFLVREGQRLDD